MPWISQIIAVSVLNKKEKFDFAPVSDDLYEIELFLCCSTSKCFLIVSFFI